MCLTCCLLYVLQFTNSLHLSAKKSSAQGSLSCPCTGLLLCTYPISPVSRRSCQLAEDQLRLVVYHAAECCRPLPEQSTEAYIPSQDWNFTTQVGKLLQQSYALMETVTSKIKQLGSAFTHYAFSTLSPIPKFHTNKSLKL